LLLDLPLLYNLHLIKNPAGDRDNPRLVLSLGGFCTFVLNRKTDDVGTAPSATLSSWGLGPYLRAAAYPIAFGRFQPGLYLNFYRSFAPKFYDEIYFRQNSSSGQLGILSCGLSLKY
jgi:hypothetical protein